MRRVVVLALAGLAALAACSPEEGDFKDEGEKFINDDERIEAAVGSDVSDAECEEPADTEIGTIYTCTALNAAGDTFEYTVEITGDNDLTVQDFQPAEG